MLYEVKKSESPVYIAAEDGTQIPAREFVVRIPMVDDGVSGVGMVSRTCGAKTVVRFDAYAVEVVDGVPTVKTNLKEIEFEGQPTKEKIVEAIEKSYPAHGDFDVQYMPGETIGLPVELFRDLAVKVIRPASQR